MIVQKNFKLLYSPQSLGVWCSECQRKQNISFGHYEKDLKNGYHFINIDHTRKISNYCTFPKVWVSGFLSVDGNRISAVGHYEKDLKNGCHFINIDHTRKISNY